MNTINPRPNPYVGPRAFVTGEHLFGRDRELRQLSQLLVARRIVLLHSPSGAGKTSLVQAGLIPRLAEEGFDVMPVARLNLDPQGFQEGDQPFNRYVFSLLQSLEEGLPESARTSVEDLARLSLTEYLRAHRQEDEEESLLALVIDQFEEVLNLDPTDREQKMAFFAQLGEALRNPRLWCLLVIREDYLGGLEPYVRAVPTRLANTYRLDLLGADQAMQAIQKPAGLAEVDFSDPAAERLADDLREMRVQQADGSFLERPGPYVEPVQLQVVCYRLWDHLPAEVTSIGEEQLSMVGDVDQSLAEYYAEQVEEAAHKSEASPREIRRWFDNKLITPDGLRGQVLMGEHQSGGLDNRAISPLVDAHLVRAEKRRGVTWFELAHDRLVRPVRLDNHEWFDRNLSLLQRQAYLWVQQGRHEGLILHGTGLDEAQAWAEGHQDSMTDDERDFLQACLKARQLRQARRARRLQELESARQLAEAEKQHAQEQASVAVKLRRQAIFLAVLLLVSMGTGALAIYFGIQARGQEAIAKTQGAIAQSQEVVAQEQRAIAQSQEVVAQEQKDIAQKAELRAVTRRQAADTAVAQAQTQYVQAKAAEATAAAAVAVAVMARDSSAATVQALSDLYEATAQAAGTPSVSQIDLESTAQAQLETQATATARAKALALQPRGNCANIDPPCTYTIREGDYFYQIAASFYGSSQFTPGLMNFNRDPNGYRKRLFVNDELFIPARQEVSRNDIPQSLYSECWEGQFPCWYQAEGKETYDTIAARFYGDSSLGVIIEDANWDWDPAENVAINGPPINPGLFLVLPAVSQSGVNTAAQVAAPYTCPGAVKPQLEVGELAYVCTQQDRLIVKDKPDSAEPELFRLYPKTEVEVVGGPVCGEEANWWRIKVPQGTIVRFGEDYPLSADEFVWTKDGTDDVDPYYLCP